MSYEDERFVDFGFWGDDQGGDGERGTQRWFTREGKKKSLSAKRVTNR